MVGPRLHTTNPPVSPHPPSQRAAAVWLYASGRRNPGGRSAAYGTLLQGTQLRKSEDYRTDEGRGAREAQRRSTISQARPMARSSYLNEG